MLTLILFSYACVQVQQELRIPAPGQVVQGSKGWVLMHLPASLAAFLSVQVRTKNNNQTRKK